MTKLNLVAAPGKHDILMWRDFDAPRELVFKAYTDPALLPQWWGSTTGSVIIDKMEVKKGGVWRYIQREADGSEYAFHGIYHQVIAPERLVSTFEFEGMPGHVLLETVTFEEVDGKTRMHNSQVFQSIEDRDGMLQTGMEDGAEITWDRFAEVLKTLA
jgi:uncharacterized protein YndB with AHSA1/START domain